MNRIKIFLFAALTLSTVSCMDNVDDLNHNPNQVATTDVDAGLYMNTPEIAIIDEQCGLFSRLCALWTGQLYGVNQVPLQHYNYQVTEATFDFNNFHNVITQCKFIQEQAPNNALYQGMTRVMEAMVFGTYASFYGDVPCSEVATDVESPKFDAQEEVFDYTQQLLSDAISYLGSVSQPQYKQDYLYEGDPQKWLEAAYTLKARFYTLTKEYDKALDAAKKGISKDANSMYFKPVDDDLTDNKNNYFEYNSITQGMGTINLEGDSCYLLRVMAARQNVKTDETARMAYYHIDPANPTGNTGIAAPLEHEPLVTYAENILTLAESATRVEGISSGIQYLNQWRSFLNNGGQVSSAFTSLAHRYEAYSAEDFAEGGLLNKDGLTPTRALLREIILERYISGFTLFMPFDDARRLRGAKESDIALDIPLNTTTATAQPERFFYPEDEMLSNPNAPTDPGLFVPTAINQ